MATIPQIQRGFAAFVDNYIANAYTGIERIIVLGGASLISATLPNILKGYANRPAVAALGIYNEEAGTVNLDLLYNSFMPHLGAEKIPIQLPALGKVNLGTIKLGKEEIDALMRYIREA